VITPGPARRRPTQRMRAQNPRAHGSQTQSQPTGAGRCPVVAVPGLGLSLRASRRVLDRLPNPGAVVELPAFGLPASPTATLHPADLAALLLRRIDDLQLAHSVLLGHSASCQIVAHAAARAPDRIRALILVGPTTDPRAGTWPALAGRWLRTASWERPWQVPLLLRDYRRTGLHSMARGMNTARFDRIDRTLAGVRCPVLIVRGRRDRIAPRQWADDLAACPGHGSAQTLPGGAHMLPLTHPRELAGCIGAFLGTVLDHDSG
jgi:pimeloyl-ACP methyl ester carboxylesterase